MRPGGQAGFDGHSRAGQRPRVCRIYLAPSGFAPAGTAVQDRLSQTLHLPPQRPLQPLDKDAAGHAELHYTGVFKLFARWAEEGSLERAFIASVQQWGEAHQLALS